MEDQKVNLNFSELELQNEIQKIVQFISRLVGSDNNIILGVSGGIDSDVTARLCAQAVGSDRLKCFIVLQDEFEEKYLFNVLNLTSDIKCQLVQIPMAPIPKQLITIISEADPSVGFRPDGLLDVARSKCALRTFIFSAYAERGYIVAGPSNRTEIELGYYLPFGDGLSHFSPIAHLYKTQVQQLARALGTREQVINQQPSAGFWRGDSDLEGIAFWLLNGAPIQVELDLDEPQLKLVNSIHRELDFRKIDTTLALLNSRAKTELIAETTQLSIEIVERISRLRERSKIVKNRALSVRMN